MDDGQEQDPAGRRWTSSSTCRPNCCDAGRTCARAEMQLAAQSARIGVSEAELYPSISLLRLAGPVGPTLAGGVAGLLSGGIGPGLVWNVFDHGRLTNTVLVQDARFQQLYEQYQDTVLRRPARSTTRRSAFAKTGEQIVTAGRCGEGRAALAGHRRPASTSEGLVDFQRVLDFAAHLVQPAGPAGGQPRQPSRRT